MAVGPRALEGLVLKPAFGGAYAGRKVLVTGHTGFKGSWLCLWLTRLGAQVSGLALAPDTDPAHWSLLGLREVQSHEVDLRDRAGVRRAIAEIRPEIIFHLAAQPLVRRSYREPLLTFETNVLGLAHLLESLREQGGARVFVNATSDKVYREQVKPAGYVEDDPLGGHDPYSSSKACAELLTACYRDSFFSGGMRIATARAGNVIGGGDWSEDRLVPDFVRAAAAGKPLEVRNPHATRPWQHVLEPLSGYLRLAQRLSEGAVVEGAWNFGPAAGGALPVRELVQQMQAIWPVESREQTPAQDLREAPALKLDSGKARHELQWQPVWDIRQGLDRTLQWYRAFLEQQRLNSQADLDDYVAAAAKAGLSWAAA